MGHIRLGELPRTKTWARVAAELAAPDSSPASCASTVLAAARSHVERVKGDAGLNYCFWLLVRIATASRQADFGVEMRQLGIPPDGITSGVEFVRRVGRLVEKTLPKRGGNAIFGRLAQLSLTDALSSRIAEQSRSLFGTTIVEVQDACRRLSTRDRFGEVSREFFAGFLSRVITFVVDKESSNAVGPSRTFASSHDMAAFQRALRTYCKETALIVEDFSGGWFSLHNWETNNAITEDDARRFTAYALKKLGDSLQRD